MTPSWWKEKGIEVINSNLQRSYRVTSVGCVNLASPARISCRLWYAQNNLFQISLFFFRAQFISWYMHKQWKKNKFGRCLIVVKLIHRLTQADISCTAMACLLFFHGLYRVGLVVWQQGLVDLDLECSAILLGQ